MTQARRGPAWRRVAVAAALLVAASGRASGQGFECEAGEREVRALEFRGNTVFRSSDLALRIVTSASDVLRRNFRIVGAKHCLDSDDLRLDVGRLRIYYRRHGYYATRVDTVVTPQVDGYGGVNVRFEIREGQPVMVDSLDIKGLDNIIAPIADTASLDLHPGIVLDLTRIQADIDSIKARLRNSGYPRSDVAANFLPDTLRRRASVHIEVVPGTRARIGSIHIMDDPLPGLPRRIGDGTIRRILPVSEGDLYNEQGLADAQRSLYQSDLFRHVDVALAIDSTASRTDSLVAIEVHVAENFLRQLDTEEGWAVLDCFKARVQFTDKNFLGQGRRIELSAQLSKIGYGQPTRIANGNVCAPAIRADSFSSRLNYFTGASLRLPTLFGLRTDPTLSIYSERRGEYQAFLRTTLVGGELAVTHDLRDAIPLRLAYSLEYGRTDAQPALFCALFNRCDAESRALITDKDRPLAVLSAHLERLRTDNPANPRFGTMVRFDVRLARRELGSDDQIQFTKGLVDASLYHGFGSWLTMAARLRLGTVLGRTLSINDPVSFVPPEERLYAGGAASVRGYQQNELGNLIYIAEVAPDTTFNATRDTAHFSVSPASRVRRVVPVGGDRLIVTNLEARLRSPFYPELVQFTVFADGGDVWQRGRQDNPDDHRASALYLNGLKWTPGIGLRAFTPVGPFQVNVGYNPFSRPLGAIYYDQAPDSTGFAPLHCVSPGNNIPAVLNASGKFEQVSGNTCPATFAPEQSHTFLSRLTLTFSIGPDF